MNCFYFYRTILAANLEKICFFLKIFIMLEGYEDRVLSVPSSFTQCKIFAIVLDMYVHCARRAHSQVRKPKKKERMS